MGLKSFFLTLLSALFLLHGQHGSSLSSALAPGPYSWMKPDKFDETMETMIKINPNNCHNKDKIQLMLPYDSLSQLPQYNTLPTTEIFPNRTAILHLHQATLSRGYFYSFVLQNLNASENTHYDLPGLMYFYFSASSDVSANPGLINGSGLFMDTNMTYPNFYTNYPHNRSIPLFAPKAWRLDDYNDEMNWLREPTNHTILIQDYGAGREHNYTASWYKTNPYVSERINYIPDRRIGSKDKHQYTTRIRTAKKIGVLNDVKPGMESNFFGPPSPGQLENELPVKFTEPYFDCGKSDKWIVSAVAPVLDMIPRYAREKNRIKPRMVGIITMDIDFLRIDFNPCPSGTGNPDYRFAGTAKCKPSTRCEPLAGWGFQRGGYQCVCQPGYRLPFYQNGPFQGADIERATEEEYRRSFDCIRSNWIHLQISEEGLNPIIARKKRSAPMSPKEKEGPYSKYNRRQQKLSLMESRKKMPYVEPKPDVPEDSSGMHLYRLKTNAKAMGNHVLSKFSSAWSSSLQFFSPSSSSAPHLQSLHKPLTPEEPSEQKLKSRLGSQASQESAPTKRLVSRYKRDILSYNGRLSDFDPERSQKIRAIVKKVNSGTINGKNCHEFRNEELEFPGEVGYGAEKQFEGKGRMALRLAHFLSSFMQNQIDDAIYGDIRGDKKLNENQLYGEVFSNVMGDLKVMSSGIFFDKNVFVDKNGDRRDYFAPYAYREMSSEPGAIPTYEAVDYKGVAPLYTELSWFKELKERWASNAYGLTRFVDKPWVRSNANGDQTRKFDNFPLYYRAPRYEDGIWTNPYFDCKGFVKDWVITYAVPFFGGNNDKMLDFMGVVTITMKLITLDINQCPGFFYTANYFKSTAACHFPSSYCDPLSGVGFKLGGYKCVCRQGYEFPFQGVMFYYDGQVIEAEYEKKLKNKPNRYQVLRCREAGVSRLEVSIGLLVGSLVLLFSWV